MNKILLKKLRRLHRKADNVFWQMNQSLRQWQLRCLSEDRKREIKRTLTEDSFTPVPGCLLTISFGSRQLGNRDNLLEQFCRSFLQMTADPKRVEIILKIDEDDDLIFFYDIKNWYKGKINLRFIVSPRGRGYADMHIWHANAFKWRSPSSLALFILTEDAEFCYKNWDTKLISMIKARPHHLFIGAPCPLEEAMRMVGPNPVKPVPVYWLVGAEFPIIGMDLLKCTQRVADRYPGWTCYGNLLLIDSFSGDMLRGLWNRHKTNLNMEVPFFVRRKGVFSWTDSQERSSVRNNTLLEFFKEENQKIRDEMVDEIYHTVSNLMSVV